MPLVASLVFVWIIIIPLCINNFCCFIVCCLIGGLLRKLVYPWVWWPLKIFVVLSRFCGTVYHDRWSPCELPLVPRGFAELVPVMMKFRKLVLFRASVPLAFDTLLTPDLIAKGSQNTPLTIMHGMGPNIWIDLACARARFVLHGWLAIWKGPNLLIAIRL